MKKHILRILTGLMIACFGVGVLAACGGDPTTPVDPDDPGTTSDPIEGVWSGAESAGMFGSSSAVDHYVATVDLLSGADHDGYVVLKITEVAAEETTAAEEPEYPTYHLAFPIDKEGESYVGKISAYEGVTFDVTLTVANDELKAVLPPFDGAPGGATGETITLTFDKKEALPAAIAPTGTLYPEDTGLPFEFDFTNKKLKMSGTEMTATYVNVGDFIVIASEMPRPGTTQKVATYYVISKIGSDYYFQTGEEPVKLVSTAPQVETTYKIVYQVSPGVTAPEDTTEYKVGDEVTLPSVSRQNYEFDGWELFGSDDDTLYDAGSTYTVKAEDADVNNEITFNAKFHYAGGEATDKYTVTYMDGSYNGTPLPVDNNKYDVGDTIQIPDTEPSVTDHTFMGWSLNGAPSPLYRYGTDHASYTITGDEEWKDLTFMAVWDTSEVPELAEIDGVWTKDTTVITVEGTHALVVKDGTQYTYYTLTEEDDHYSAVGMAGVTFTPNAEGTQLTYTVSENDTVFTEKGNLPGHISLTGKWTLTVAGTGDMTIDFDSNSLDAGGPQTFTPVAVGGYLILPVPEMYANIYVYADGSNYYGYAPDLSMSAPVQLTPYTPPTELGEIEDGTWTSGDTTIVIDGDKALVITGTQYILYTLTEADDHYAATGKDLGSSMAATATFTPTADGFTYTVSEDPTTFTTHETFTHLELNGEYQNSQGTVVIDFTQNKLSISTDALTPIDGATFTDVGGYIVIEATIPEMEGSLNLVIYMSEEKVMAWSSMEGKAAQLTPYTPAPTTHEYTVNFWKDKSDDYGEAANSNQNYVATATFELADDATISDKSAESTQWPSSEPTKQYYTFAGWYFDDDTPYEAGEFVPSEHHTEYTINIYAKWIIVIGNDELTNAYPGDFGDVNSGIEFQDTIAKGNHYIFTGTQRSAVSLEGAGNEQNYKSLKFYIWSGDKPKGVFRLDRAVGDGSEWEPDHGRGAALAAAENWVITMGSPTGFGDKDAEYRKALQNGSIVLDVDWVNASVITIKITLTASDGKENGYFEQVYTIEGQADHPLAETYKFGFGAEASQTKFTKYEVTQQPLPSEFNIGTDAFKLTFTADTPAWFGNSITSGKKAVVTGTLKTAGAAGYQVPIAYIMSKKGYANAILRTDGWIGGNAAAEFLDVVSDEGIENATTNYNTEGGKATAEADTQFLTAVREGEVTFTLTYDWTDASRIVITAKFEKGGMTRTTTFTVTAQAEHAFAEEYYIGLGGEKVFLQVNNVNYNVVD